MRTAQYSLLIWAVYILPFPTTDVRATHIRKIDSDTRSHPWGKWSSWSQCIRGRKSKYRDGVNSRKLELFQKETLVCHNKPVGAVTTSHKSNYPKERDVSDNTKGTGYETSKLVSKLSNLTETAASKIDNNFTESNWAAVKPPSLEGSEKKRLSSNLKNLTTQDTPNETMFTEGENDHGILVDNVEPAIRIQNKEIAAITHGSSSDISQIADDPECKRNVREIHCPRAFSWSFPCGRLYKNGTMTSSCYKRMAFATRRDGADIGCSIHKSKLVSIESRSENLHLGKFLKKLGGTDYRYWTSGSDWWKEGSWEWTATGEPVTFTNWDGHEPDNSGDEDYLAIGRVEGSSALTYWTDKDYHQTFHYICEINVRETEV